MTGLNDNILSKIDFPTGSSRRTAHPKLKLLSKLIREHAIEYSAAGMKSERRQYQGRRMRTKTAIIDLVAKSILPTGGGVFKKYRKDGTWAIDTSYKSPQKLRTRVSNEFNKFLKAQAESEAETPEEQAAAVSGGAEIEASSSSKQHPIVLHQIQDEAELKYPSVSSHHRNPSNNTQECPCPMIIDPPESTIITTPRKKKAAAKQEVSPLSPGKRTRAPSVSSHHRKPSNNTQECPRPITTPGKKKAAAKQKGEVSPVSAGKSTKAPSVSSHRRKTSKKAQECPCPMIADPPESMITTPPKKKAAAKQKGEVSPVSAGKRTTAEWYPCEPWDDDSLLDDGIEIKTWKTDTVASVLTAMQAYCKDNSLQQSWCYLLGNMARLRSKDDDSFVRLRGSNTILATMHFHKDNGIVQQMACYALGQWAMHDPSNQTSIAAAGSFQLIINAMTNHSRCAKVQSYASFALGTIMRNHLANQSANLSVACIRAVLSAMRLHRDDARMQYYGCFALGNMVRDHPENQSIIGGGDEHGCGAVEVVLKASIHHANNANVQSNSCFALGCLVWKHAANRSRAMTIAGGATTTAGGAVHFIISTMDRHRDNATVQSNGCFALGCLMYGNHDQAAPLLAASVRENAMFVLERHVGHARVVEASLNLLCSCCPSLLNKKRPATTMLLDDASFSSLEHVIISRAILKHQSTHRRIAVCGSILLRNTPLIYNMDDNGSQQI